VVDPAHVRIRRLICTRASYLSDAARNLRGPFLIASARTACVPQIAREAAASIAASTAIRIAKTPRGGARGVVNVATAWRARRDRGGFAVDRCIVAKEAAPLRGCTAAGSGASLSGRPGDFAGNDSLRSGDCHAMFVSVMPRKRARLMADRKNDRNAQALPLITDSTLRPSRIIVYYVRPGKDLFIAAGTHSAINNQPNRKIIPE
jgi:hypothetical protein